MENHTFNTFLFIQYWVGCLLCFNTALNNVHFSPIVAASPGNVMPWLSPIPTMGYFSGSLDNPPLIPYTAPLLPLTHLVISVSESMLVLVAGTTNECIFYSQL